MKSILVWTFLFLVLVNLAQGLRLIDLEVPQPVISGEETTLTCVFDLEGDTLYSIKWYRDDLEFFRYVPSDKPPNQFFSLTGLKIDLDRSSNGTVFISDVDQNTAGAYKCEISADAPSFQTVFAEKILTITDPDAEDVTNSSTTENELEDPDAEDVTNSSTTENELEDPDAEAVSHSSEI